MKIFYFFLFLLGLTIRPLFGQTDIPIIQTDSTSKQKKHYFGIGHGLIYNTKPQLISSPVVQLYPSTHLCIYFGPSFLILLDEKEIRNKASFRMGTFYSPWYSKNKKIKPYIKSEFSRIQYEFNSYLYDYATPNIPIKATVLHEHKSFGFNFNLGVAYHMKDRFFIGGDLGMKLLWEKNFDPGTYQAYASQKYGEQIPLQYSRLYSFSIETGIYF